MIVTVTLNASIDRRYIVKNFVEGEVTRVSKCTATSGGKGLNVSRLLAIQNAEVTATGFVGGFAGKFIENEIEKLGVKSRFYHLEAESRCCINLWDEEKKLQSEFLEPGFVVEDKDRDSFLNEFGKIIENANVVAMSGSVPGGIGTDYYGKLVRIAKEQNKTVILDTSGDYLKEGIKAKPSLIKPNIDEIRMLTGSECSHIEEIVNAAEAIHKKGVENVVVSLGGEGSVLACSEGTYRAIVPKIDAANTVGCGDAMISGFAKGFDDGLSIVDTIKLASAVSAASAMREETGFFNIKDMRELLDKIKIIKM